MVENPFHLTWGQGHIWLRNRSDADVVVFVRRRALMAQIKTRTVKAQVELGGKLAITPTITQETENELYKGDPTIFTIEAGQPQSGMGIRAELGGDDPLGAYVTAVLAADIKKVLFIDFVVNARHRLTITSTTPLSEGLVPRELFTSG